MAVVICRGWLGSAGVESTLSQATACLAIFSIVGVIIGQIAQTTVDESVRSKLQQQLNERAEMS